MTKNRDLLPPLMLVMLPPEVAQQVVDHLLEQDAVLAADLAALRKKYTARLRPPALPRSSTPINPAA